MLPCVWSGTNRAFSTRSRQRWLSHWLITLHPLPLHCYTYYTAPETGILLNRDNHWLGSIWTTVLSAITGTGTRYCIPSITGHNARLYIVMAVLIYILYNYICNLILLINVWNYFPTIKSLDLYDVNYIFRKLILFSYEISHCDNC